MLVTKYKILNYFVPLMDSPDAKTIAVILESIKNILNENSSLRSKQFNKNSNKLKKSQSIKSNKNKNQSNKKINQLKMPQTRRLHSIKLNKNLRK